MRPNHISRIAGATLALLLVCASSDTFAAGTRFYHPSGCQVVRGQVDYNFAGQIGNVTEQEVELWCPLTGDNDIRASVPNAIVTVSVFSNGCVNNVPGIAANVCYASAEGGPGTCGIVGSTPNSCNPGVFQLSPVTPLLGGGHYHYLKLVLRKQINGSSNTFFGYKLTNP